VLIALNVMIDLCMDLCMDENSMCLFDKWFSINSIVPINS